jgi:hypothetical protein
MTSDSKSFSAAPSALGYLYQLRYALLCLLRQSEDTVCLIEGDDDIDFSDPEEGRILASLKHKAVGDTLSDLSPDFWKSVRIWLAYYLKDPRPTSPGRFYLCSTGSVSPGSLLEHFLPTKNRPADLAAQAKAKLETSDSKTLAKTKVELESLSDDQLTDFFSRITIFDQLTRIENIPQKIIDEKLRTVRIQFRQAVYQRLEGWWTDQCIKLLSDERADPMRGSEVSEMLSFICEQFRDDNLPIDFENAEPEEGVDPDSDDRIFVRQLRTIGLKSGRIKTAILDYYRACQQRSEWLRINVDLTGEIDRYDERLVNEWNRLKQIVWEELAEDAAEEILQMFGRKLFNDLSTSDHPNLRIRVGVTATYVAMGSYHLLANERMPRVYWHPRFEERATEILKNTAV